MSLGMDDRLLGEKVHNYCSSDEDERDDEDDDDRSLSGDDICPNAPNLPEPEAQDYDGHSTNTGPKGVIKDWQRFKQLETEKRTEQDAERLQLAKKLTLTCRSHLDEEREKAKDEAFLEEMDKEFGQLEDEFLKEYRERRIDEMKLAFANMPRFGDVASLTRSEYIEAIDNENPSVTVVIHIYQEGVRGCEAMNGCLMCLAQQYPTIKFCKILASDTNLSYKFSASGVPALLIYKNKDLIGNFIRVTDELGDDFFATDVENFLSEHGMLPDKTLKPLLQAAGTAADTDSDSDFDVE